MKKLTLALLTSTLLLGGLASCSSDSGTTTSTDSSNNTASNATTQDTTTVPDVDLIPLKVGASPAPHCEILDEAKSLLAEQGYELVIVEYVDYVQPNLALDQGELDANYFQHQPYLDQFNAENGTDLVTVSTVHYEPFGIYPGKSDALNSVSEGATIAVPNDASNEARALLLLEAQGIISLKEGAGITATKNDIEANYFNVDIKELEAAQIPRSLQDVDFAVINGNYAVEAGLHVAKDSLAQEDAESISATTYGNILVVKAGNEDNEGVQALVDVLEGAEISEFITEKYEGAVLPLN